MKTEIFLLQAKCGTTPPRYEHHDLASAVIEAKRLHTLLKTDVKILKVIGEVKFVEVPVTRTETKVDIWAYNEDDQLPF